ncbi:helix-turn-helix transcriptional regulator [Oscillibacter sp.]|uniref:helix-turn-helix domain-containing protein n=1 Tax=Oscillibacter sp. TaxID=1945593 RepID=UPI0028A0938E|nr:helix-turn-helix transcriptional regulator [Oscillibacter sp.]
MITMAQRIQQLRAERGVSAPALSAALGLPRTAVEKFETGRQTPTQDQQQKLASYFGVSAFYLRGESDDRTQMSDWMDGAFMDDPAPAPPAAPVRPAKKAAPAEDGSVFDAFLNSKKFQELLRVTVLDVLRSSEGQALIEKAARKAGGR